MSDCTGYQVPNIPHDGFCHKHLYSNWEAILGGLAAQGSPYVFTENMNNKFEVNRLAETIIGH